MRRTIGFAALVPTMLAACASSPSAAPDASQSDAGPMIGSDVTRTSDSSAPSDVPSITDDSGVPVPAAMYPTPTCTQPNEIPLPFSDPQSGPHTYGEFRCHAAGAQASTITGDWPDTSAARRPLVYVKVGGTGDGSSPTSPLPTIAAGLTALTNLGNGTLVLSADTHNVTATTAITNDLSILGVAGRTHVAAGTTAPAFDVVPATGTTASLAVNGVEFDGATGFVGSMLHASSGGTLTLRDVIVDRAEHAISVDGGVVDATGVTLQNLTGRGVNLGFDGDGRLRSMIVRGGTHGIFADSSRVSASMVGIFGATFGVAVMSDTPVTATLDRVAAISSGKIGVALSGAGVTAAVQRAMVAGTMYSGTDGAGIGILARDHAVLGIDTDIATDAMQGRGTQVRANEATGVVIDTGAHAEMHGLLVGSNGQSGITIQNSAVVGNIGESYFHDNVGVGLVVSTAGSIAGLLCNGFVANRAGTMRFGATSVRMLDGVDIVPGAGARFSMVVTNSMFIGHEGYGLMCNGIDATISGSTFMNNGIGWALFDGTPMAQGNTTTDNRESPPAMFTGEAPGAVTTTLDLH